MKNLNWKFNEEYKQYEATFNAKLKSVSPELQQNVNGTPYFFVTADLDGESITALMYENNYNKGVEIGETYSCRAINNPERGDDLLITMSHLVSGNRLKASDLGLTKEVMQKAKAGTEASVEEVSDVAEEYETQS